MTSTNAKIAQNIDNVKNMNIIPNQKSCDAAIDAASAITTNIID
jgi:hypothetical protein